VLSRIGGPAAQYKLLTQIEPAEWRVRLAAYAALRGCESGCPPYAEKLLWEQIDTLACTAAWALAAAADLPVGTAHFDALRRSLSHEVDKSITGVFDLLACLSPGLAIDDAREGLLHGPAHKRGYALEAIEQALPTAVRGRVMALLEAVSAEESQKQLSRYFAHPSLPLEARLADILSTNDRIGPWTATVALFVMARSEIRPTFDSAALAGRFNEDVVHEILAWMNTPAQANPQVAGRAQTGSGDRPE
jgi:hypothetical protein